MSFFNFLNNILAGKAFGGGAKAVSIDTKGKISRDWQSIDVLIKGGMPSQLRQALIKADKTVDTALKDLVLGETMGERLKNAKDLFDRDVYDKIWKAHKVRNRLVHEADYEPQHFIVKEAIKNLRNGLKGINVYV
jgi:hypothetical protein